MRLKGRNESRELGVEIEFKLGNNTIKSRIVESLSGLKSGNVEKVLQLRGTLERGKMQRVGGEIGVGKCIRGLRIEHAHRARKKSAVNFADGHEFSQKTSEFVFGQQRITKRIVEKCGVVPQNIFDCLGLLEFVVHSSPIRFKNHMTGVKLDLLNESEHCFGQNMCFRKEFVCSEVAKMFCALTGKPCVAQLPVQVFAMEQMPENG